MSTRTHVGPPSPASPLSVKQKDAQTFGGVETEVFAPYAIRMDAKPTTSETLRSSFTVVAEIAAIVAAVAGCVAVYLEYSKHSERVPAIDVFANVQATSRIENDTMTPYVRLFVSVLNRSSREIVFDAGDATFHREKQAFTYRLVDSPFGNDYKVAPRQRLNFETTVKPEVLLPSRAQGEINLHDTLDNQFSGSIMFTDSIESDWERVTEQSDRFNSMFKKKVP